MHDPNQPPPQADSTHPISDGVEGYEGYIDPGHAGFAAGGTATEILGAGAVMESVKHTQENKSKAAALSIAVLVHAVLLAALAIIVIKELVEPPPDLVVAATQSSAESRIDKKEFVQNTKSKPSRPSAKPSSLINAMAQSPIAVQSLDIPVDTPNIGSSFGAGFGGGGFGDGMGGGMAVPAVMKGRCDAADRAKRLRESGGEMKMDRAVVKALRWLKSKQNSDGSWGTEYPASMTGLALLAFCGHCETVDSPEFGETVMKAISYLVEKGEQADGAPIASVNGRTTSYEHAIVIYALAESYSLNKNSRKKFTKISPVLKKGVPVIIDGQTSAGGWLYAYGSNGKGDLSVSGWNVQALKAAELTGLNYSGLGTSMKKALSYLDEADSKNGKFMYRVKSGDPGKDTLIGVGLLCKRMLGEVGKHEDEGFEIILSKKPAADAKNMNVYSWTHNSQAAFQRGGSVWRDYNRSYQQVVMNTQAEDGSWSGGGAHGELRQDVPIYHTSLCTLMLEVYYRYLPATDNKRKGSKSGLIDRN